MPSSNSVRLEDIARQLRISVATVSRALSGDARVKAATRELVLQTAAQMGYVPNSVARGLRKGRTYMLGVLIPKYDDAFFVEIVKGVEHAARSRQYKVLIASSEQSYQRERESTQMFQQGGVDGLLVCLCKETRRYQHFEQLIKRNIPIVQFDCVSKTLASDRVTTDDVLGARQAVDYLLNSGRRRIAYLGGPAQLEGYQNRLRGYREALQAAQIPYDEQLIVHSDHGARAGDMEVIANFLKKLQPLPDGIFASNDLLAILAMKSLKRMGLKIPEDIAIVGYGNSPFSTIYEPALSTVFQPAFEMGEQATQLLIERIESSDNESPLPFQDLTLPTYFIQREST